MAVSTSPQRGQEQPLDAPVVITFDQPMDAASTAAAFAIEPETAGQAMLVGNDLVWTPAQPLARGESYRVSVSQEARSATNEPLAAPVDLRFNAVGFLQVTSSQPADGNEEVSVDSPITVIFNRPVVPLTGGGGGEETSPLRIEPATPGAGQWLNTSIYSFTPKTALAGGATYKVTVPAGLTDASGGLLAEDVVINFQTASPIVLTAAPDGPMAWPTKPITVTFSQPMDRASTQAAFALRHADAKTQVTGRFIWSEGSRVLRFQPLTPLAYDTAYTVQIGQSARAAAGQATLRQPFVSRFQTAPLIGIGSTSPPDGATGVAVEEQMGILFQGLVDESTLGQEAFTILPEPSGVFSYFNSYDNSWQISWPRLPETSYTVTLSGDIQDVFGNRLGTRRFRFETGQRRPFAHLNVPNDIGTYNAYTSTLIAASYRNVSELNFKLYSVSEKEATQLLGQNRWDALRSFTPKADALLRAWTTPVSPEPNSNNLIKIPLAEDGGPLPAGIYWVEMRAPEVKYGDGSTESGQTPPRHLLIVSPFNLITKRTVEETLVWVTDLQSGQPVAGVPVRLVGDSEVQVVSDVDGIARGAVTTKEPWTPITVFAGVTGSVGDRPEQGSVAGSVGDRPEQDGPIPYGVTSTDWQSGLASWDFGLPSEFPPPLYQGYFYTDRPIYRPGQTVYWKGILRVDDDAILRLPEPGTKVNVTIYNDRGEEIYKQQHETNAFGTIDGALPLAEEASLGFYNLEARLADWPQDAYFVPYFGLGFQVAEYRKPEFTIDLTTEKPEVLHGDLITATVSGEFFFGGPVSNAQVTWTVFSEDATFDFTGDSGGRWYSFNDYTGWDPTTQGRYGGVVASGEGKTGADGTYTFQVPADIGDKSASQRFNIDARVTDLNNQETAKNTSVIVHKGLIYPGVAPRGYVSLAGQPADVDLITVDWASQPVANQALTVVVSQAEWLSVQKQADDGRFYWTSEVRETPILTDTVTTDGSGQAVYTWTPPSGGQYKINATAVDELGNAVRSAAFTWVSSGSQQAYVSWQVENNDRIELVADQPLYQVGDTAKILVPHPYEGPVEALLTIERGQIIETRRVTLEGNSETLEIPITEEYVPNVFVSVVVVKGGSVGDRPQQENELSGSVGDRPQQGSGQGGSVGDRPQQEGGQSENSDLGSFKLGLVELPVDNTVKEITLTLTPNAGVLRPGETVTFTVQATDWQGKPLQAEISLALIDKAILSLAQSPNQPLLDSFYRQRGLGVQTASNLVLNLDRLNLQLEEGAKGGGGGDGMMGIEVRSEFEDTALWEPTLVTDEKGLAQVSVTLPDNLTTWRLEGIGVTVDTHAGQATVEIKTTLPLLVRPVLPRFFTVGDQAEIAAIVNNNTEADRTVEVILAAQGVTTTASLSQIVSAPAGQQVKVSWPVEVTTPTGGEAVSSAVIRFTALETGAAAGQQPLSDAVELTLPVYRYSSPETVATAGTVGPDESRTEVIVLPPNVDATQGELRVRLDPSLAAGTLESLNWLKHFPYECSEQIVSKFLPNVVTYQALTTLGLTGFDTPPAAAATQPTATRGAGLEANLKDQIAVATQQLLQRQNPDGGWGWWANDESRAFVSSYVTFGLVRAQAAGFAVDSAALKRAIGYLQRQLRPVDALEGYELNQQAFILYVLAEAGQGDMGRTTALYQVRERLGHYGQALLAMTFALLDDPTSAQRIATLLDDLNGAAVLSATGAHWEEASVDWWTMSSDLRSTAMVLDALVKTSAGEETSPLQASLAPNAVRWLMSMRTDGRWATTQENVWSLIALTDWMAATGELEGDYSFDVTLNDQPLGSGSVNADNVGQPVDLRVAVADLLQDYANGLTISRFSDGSQSGEGQLYYTAFLETFLPAAELQAMDRGVVVAQQYRLVDPLTGKASEQPISQAQVGDTIQVKLTIVAPTNLHYLVVESPLPAGAEAIDPSLLNTSLVYEGPELQPADGQWPWFWWTPTSTELRDEKVALFATELPAGTYEYTYQMRASLPGQFQVLPAVAYQMYFPEVWGRSAGATFGIGQ
ncbi:MAG TPA: Ig-like domain-containing protein [Anaerolineae bacterium]|nr:Ig-like domain-containing protein [Anaerolineae bacterium]